MIDEHHVRSEHATRLRWSIYALLIVVATAGILSRIATVRSSGGRTPMLSANDRSRWATVRSLVERGGYELDSVIFVGPQRRRSAEWYTIDLVRHRGPDGHEHFYSSKPPLLSTLVAGLYWPLHHGLGLTMRHDAMLIIRTLLVVVNVVPLVAAFVLLAGWAERYARSDWARYGWMAVATFGTFLSTFAITLNNHLPAAISTLFATYAALRIAHEGRVWPRYFVAAGFCAAFAAATELPALSFAVLLSALLLLRFPRPTLLYFAPAAAVVTGAFFVTSYLAHGTWRPAYGSRSDGETVATLPAPQPQVNEPLSPDVLRELREAGLTLSPQAHWLPRPTAASAAAVDLERLQIWDPELQQRYAAGWSAGQLEVRAWGNWYEYEGSYWLDGNKRGVDRGEPDRGVYAFHVLLGHHGVFSLTPVWLLALWGIGLHVRRGDRVLQIVALAVALITLVCFAFYLSRPLIDRNYGGVTSGFRWSFWLIPLWLWGLLRALDEMATRSWLRGVLLVLLAVSVFSASYPSRNPFSHPWLFDLGTWAGWWDYDR